MSEEDKNCNNSSSLSEEYSDSESLDFLQALPKEQQDLMKNKLSTFQSQFKVYNDNQKRQKITDVLTHLPELSENAAQLAIDSCKNNELLAIKRLLEDNKYRETVIAMSNGEIPMDLDSIMYVDKRQVLRDILLADSDDAGGQEGQDIDDQDNWEIPKSSGEDIHFSRSSIKKRSNRLDSHSDHRSPRLCLDDALIMLAGLQVKNEEKKEDNEKTKVVPTEIEQKKEIEPKKNATPKKKKRSKHSSSDSDGSDFSEKPSSSSSTIAKEADFFRALSGSASKKIPTETLRQLGWSEARIKAFRNREKNPNQYYYRFNDPGEPQQTGKWSPKDKALFLKLIREKGVDYQWGIFSKQIPGRVGYQCSNFYRQLIKEGEIHDDNYSFDKDGKLVFRFHDKNGRRTLARHSKRKNSSDLSDFENPANAVEEENILPNYIDPMTMMPVVKPAISPYGHVMGYDSWVKLLNRNPKNTCPFTKKKLTRRSLVKLTSENIDQYRDKIINANGCTLWVYFLAFVCFMHSTLFTYDTTIYADSVEVIPNSYDGLFLAGTYQLDEQTRLRNGTIQLFQYCKEEKKVLPYESIKTSGILDMKLNPQEQGEKHTVAVALSDGYLSLIPLDYSNGFKDIWKESEHILVDSESTICLSVDWSNQMIPNPNPLIAVSLSNGQLAICSEEEGQLTIQHKWNAHSLMPGIPAEVWITSFDPSDANCLYSGGDDGSMKLWDLRLVDSYTSPVAICKQFEAGVTSMCWNKYDPSYITVGSYDGHIRIFDKRQIQKPVSDYDVQNNAGIWRIKYKHNGNYYLNSLKECDFATKNEMLIAGMRAGFIVLDYDDHHQIQQKVTYLEQGTESLPYGVDYVHCEEDNSSPSGVVGSCSFYNHLLHVWEYDYSLCFCFKIL